MAVELDFFEVMGVGMLLERRDPNPRKAVRLIEAGEKVRPEYALASATIEERELLAPGRPVVALASLVRMKLLSNRDQDRVHLRDMIDVGLFGREMLAGLQPELAARLDALLTETGR